jgi:hypothetical protein
MRCTSTTRLFALSPMKTSPPPSTATPTGVFSPLATVVWAPPSAGTLTTRSLPVSAMKTSPAPSTATPKGSFSPLATVVWAPPLAGNLHNAVIPAIRDEDIARSIHRHAGGEGQSAAHRGLDACKRYGLTMESSRVQGRDPQREQHEQEANRPPRKLAPTPAATPLLSACLCLHVRFSFFEQLRKNIRRKSGAIEFHCILLLAGWFTVANREGRAGRQFTPTLINVFGRAKEFRRD